MDTVSQKSREGRLANRRLKNSCRLVKRWMDRAMNERWIERWMVGRLVSSRLRRADYGLRWVTVTQVFFSVLSGAFTLGNALPYVNSVATAVGSSSSVFSVVDRKPDIDAQSDAGTKPSTIKGRIRFQDVHFSYPSRPNIKVSGYFDYFVYCIVTSSHINELRI